LSVEQFCNSHNCPVDCEVTLWTHYETCSHSCGRGEQTRRRSVARESLSGGKACPKMTESRECNTFGCDKDCSVTDYSNWDACSKTCGYGHQFRHRKVATEPELGGKACPTLSEERVCHNPDCAANCVQTSFSKWHDCSATCGIGTRRRHRMVISPVVTVPGLPRFVCPANQEIKECNRQPCPIDCVMGNWTSGTECTQLCGSGTTTKHRQIQVETAFGGKACGVHLEILSCNTQPCSQDCQITAFGNWSACTVTCGGAGFRRESDGVYMPGTGYQSRGRTVTQMKFGNSGQACPHLFEVRPCNEYACPVDCAVSQWTDYGTCSETCGTGTSTRTRSVVTPASNYGASCPDDLSQSVNCNLGVCPENQDCVLSSWGGWGPCSTGCGGGVRLMIRTITNEALNNGLPCSTNLTMNMTCNTQDCPTHCEVTDFSDYGSCSVSCGGGFRSRDRNITSTADAQGLYSGIQCPHLAESVACNEHDCPSDCMLHPFSEWSTCSHSCDSGKQSRGRSLQLINAFGGKGCPNMVETRVCNNHTCPLDCEVSAWAHTGSHTLEWSSCTEACGGGEQTRERTVETPPSHGGAVCPVLNETRNCHTQACALVPVDCVLSGYGSWSECSLGCGGGEYHRTRNVTTHDSNGGLRCESLFETGVCNNFMCPVHCTVAVVSDWSDCSRTCGVGVMTRVATSTSAFTAPECPSTVQERSCSNSACPQNCVATDFGSWGACSKPCDGGSQSRVREIAQSAVGTGAACTDMQQTQDCNTRVCIVDCKVGVWGDYDGCSESCGKGTQTRARQITTNATSTGSQCPHLTHTRVCAEGACPINCDTSGWSAWSDCSRSCGEGQLTRTKFIKHAEFYGGDPCPSELSQINVCQLDPCPVHCVMTAIGDWSKCSKECGTGTTTLRHEITVHQVVETGGIACPPLVSTKTCNMQACPEDCTTTPWHAWSACSKTCGPGGVQTRKRYVAQPTVLTGQGCPHLSETTECVGTQCPVHCEVSPFSPWGNCTAACGGGTETRTRHITQNEVIESGGLACPHLSESQPCVAAPCAVNCAMSDFSELSACTVTCGEGQQEKSRYITTYAEHGGAACVGNLTVVEKCIEGPCPIHCKVSEWSVFGGCSQTCGSGVHSRWRTVTKHPKHGGYVCPSLADTLACNAFPCPIDCDYGNFSVWGNCSESCGGGTATRTRSIFSLPAHQGEPCPSTVETKKCNEQGCVVECVMSNYGDWGACSGTCGAASSQTRVREVVVAAANGGAGCPTDLMEHRGCNNATCPKDCVLVGGHSWLPCSAACGGGTKTRTRTVYTHAENGGIPCPDDLTETQNCNENACRKFLCFMWRPRLLIRCFPTQLSIARLLLGQTTARAQQTGRVNARRAGPDKLSLRQAEVVKPATLSLSGKIAKSGDAKVCCDNAPQ
jgi:hypothetical protein